MSKKDEKKTTRGHDIIMKLSRQWVISRNGAAVGDTEDTEIRFKNYLEARISRIYSDWLDEWLFCMERWERDKSQGWFSDL